MSLRVTTTLLAFLLIARVALSTRADELDDLTGTYVRTPVENGWHVVTVTREPGSDVLRWKNKAGVSWTLTPDLKNRVARTDKGNPYFNEPGKRDLPIIYQKGKPVGFRFGNESYLREGVKEEDVPGVRQSGYGLHGYVTVGIEPPPRPFAYGFSFYSTAFKLLDKPINDFQAGLAGTWVIPQNGDFKQPLVPPGTVARDTMPERGPTYSDVFQTIEGSLGFWASTRFGSASPKYRMNGTFDGYSHEISSPGWGFGRPKPVAPEALSIAQLSNRLLVPPDGFTFDGKTKNELMGVAWMALPLVQAERDADGVTTGDQSWTFFANTTNFAGPVAFWVPDAWSRLSKRYRVIDGRGLDSRPASVGSIGMEIAQMPCFEARDGKGVLYRRIPRLNFPANGRGQSVLTMDVAAYSKQAIFDRLGAYLQAGATGKLGPGRFDAKGVFFSKLNLNKAKFDTGKDKTEIAGTEGWFEEKLFGKQPTVAYGLQWTSPAIAGHFPEYFKEVKGKMTPIAAKDVPAELGLAKAEFDPPAAPQTYASPDDAKSIWKAPGPKAGPFKAELTDGSVVTYAWYRFIDQPTIVAQGWSQPKRDRLQKLVERIHADWPITGAAYMAPPSQGTLAKLDPTLLVTPPAGLEVGYVPIVTRQALVSGK